LAHFSHHICHENAPNAVKEKEKAEEKEQGELRWKETEE
jgi:hypothetical protein